MALNNKTAKRRRYICNYKDDRFTLQFYVGSVKDWGGLYLLYTDKENPEYNIGASFSEHYTKDWIQASTWYGKFLEYITQELDKKETTE